MSASPHAIPVTFELEQKYDYWGEPIMWVFSPDSVMNCLRDAVQKPENLVLQACAAARGVAEGDVNLTSVHFDHFQEGDFQIIFRVEIVLVDDDRQLICLLLAKDGDELSDVVRTEHLNLATQSARHPAVVAPLAAGQVEIVDEETGTVAQLAAYATAWLSDFHELGVNRDMNFFVNEQPFHDFSSAETDGLKRDMLAILFSLYDPATHRGLEVPLIGAGDFMVTRPTEGEDLALRLIALGPMQEFESLEDFLATYIRYEGEWGEQVFRLRPTDESLVLEAAAQGLVANNGLDSAEVESVVRRILTTPSEA